MKNKIVVFNNCSRSSVYGIGTYTDQLVCCIKNSHYCLDIIYIISRGSEIVIEAKNGYREISIPDINYNHKNARLCYYRNLVYMLKMNILDCSDTRYIFHLNIAGGEHLVKYIKNIFKSSIVFVCHYTNWSFTLNGDEAKFEKIVNTPRRKLKSQEDKDIYDSVAQDVKAINRCDAFVCVAQHTINSFNKTGKVKAQRVEVIHNSLKDCYIELSAKEKSKIKNELNFPDNAKIVLFAGRLDSVKGVAFLIDAFKKAAGKNKNAYLLIAGDGDFSTLMEHTEGCWGRVIFAGLLDRERLYRLYQIADLGVVSSLHEEFGYVAIEMMMHKLPIIVGDTGGLADIVEHRISGLKVSVNIIDDKRVLNIDKLSEYIDLLLNNKSLSNELASNGRKRFLEQFESDLFNEKMLSLYNSLILKS